MLKFHQIHQPFHKQHFVKNNRVTKKSGKKKQNYLSELNKIKKCAKKAINIGLEVHAGHGIDYKTAKILTKVKEPTASR